MSRAMHLWNGQKFIQKEKFKIKKMKFKTILRLRQTHSLDFKSNIFKELPGADHKIKGDVQRGRIWSDDPRLATRGEFNFLYAILQ